MISDRVTRFRPDDMNKQIIPGKAVDTRAAET